MGPRIYARPCSHWSTKVPSLGLTNFYRGSPRFGQRLTPGAGIGRRPSTVRFKLNAPAWPKPCAEDYWRLALRFVENTGGPARNSSRRPFFGELPCGSECDRACFFAPQLCPRRFSFGETAMQIFSTLQIGQVWALRVAGSVRPFSFFFKSFL